MGIKEEKKPIRPKLGRPSTAGARVETGKMVGFGGNFEGVPGHKRRETISVASTKGPAILPRINRSAMLRQQKEVAPPLSSMFKLPGSSGLVSKTKANEAPGLGRSRSVEPMAHREPIVVASTRPPSVVPRGNRSSMLRVKKDTQGQAPSSFRQWGSLRGATGSNGGAVEGSGSKVEGEGEGTSDNRKGAGTGRASSRAEERKVNGSSKNVNGTKPVAVTGTGSVANRGPSIEPRSNRSAVLRAATRVEKTGTNCRTGQPNRARAFI